ncbi:RdgB/HAM1 family non-canonical purine NTP pyrophosphatase [Telmatospirillum sp. J64-1]|uniref:RdgB/HAM1 family non-canonical purine NTP pyrophosphatase n=1 Tax=Telmatospirillum sp. J64-1 TaxID=2502183 RepID=UPI00115D3E4E|nr:RdgB/HAM1 family non-canonical purine NTP pyrophosphatase [Telmatospirillum sp. J64-1]
MRRFTEKKLVIATHNAGKLREIAELLAPYGVEVVSAGELGLPEPEETGSTFVENAELKARAAAMAAKLPALADDSGMAVDGLGGLPGIYSARWAGPSKDFGLAMAKVHDALNSQNPGGEADRSARFVCALSLCWPDGEIITFEGVVHGELVWPPRGENGFGYDPMFLPQGSRQTFGEMDADAKHAISHRAEAFRKMVDALFA